MTSLRRIVPHWPAVLLAASLLFCAAIVLNPLTVSQGSSGAARLRRTATVVEARGPAMETVGGIRQASERPQRALDGPVMRVSAGAR